MSLFVHVCAVGTWFIPFFTGITLNSAYVPLSKALTPLLLQIRINVPSYCDRVLWRSYPNAPIVNTSYGCTNDIMTSDHSPVFATFQLVGIKQYAGTHSVHFM